MGVLDGMIRNTFGAAFGAIYLDGTLHRGSRIEGAGGSFEVAWTDVPVKGQKDACTEAMRGEAGYTDEDVRLIVLQAGVGAAPTSDDEITLAGRRWKVATVDSDPAESHWVIRGQPS